jgi:hypothetical protein
MTWGQDMVYVNTVSEIAEIIKDQEKAMRDLLRGEKNHSKRIHFE